MAQQKIQSVQLSDTGVVPGPYTNADVTVDASGRVTAVSNGTGGAGTVTSIDVAGSPGKLSSAGGPITTTGTITMDLVASGVTAGSYSTADITVDQYGRITAAANGAGAPALTATEVAYGSVGNTITSTPDFTYDDGTGTLALGPIGFDALIQANVGQAITLSGDTGAELESNSNTFGLSPDGEVLVNGSAGTSGQVLTSTGPTTPATWTTPSGGGGTPTFIVRLFGNSNTQMNRSMFTDFTGVVAQTSTEASWLSYPKQISLEANGFWRIIVVGYANPGPGGSWPDFPTAYGTYVSVALPYSQTSQYFRTATPGFPTGWGFLGSAAQIATWTDEFIVEVTSQPLTFQVALYAEEYNGGGNAVHYNAVVTAQRIL